MKDQRNPSRTLTILQVMDVVLALCCIGFGGCMVIDLLNQMNHNGNSWHAAAAVLFVLVIVGCLTAQGVFFKLCGNLKDKSAFTPANDTALGIIAAACGINTILLLCCGAASIIGSALYFLQQSAWANTFFEALSFAVDNDAAFYGLLAFLMVSVALIAWILQLMLRRAVALQQENDETV